MIAITTMNPITNATISSFSLEVCLASSDTFVEMMLSIERLYLSLYLSFDILSFSAKYNIITGINCVPNIKMIVKITATKTWEITPSQPKSFPPDSKIWSEI